MNITQLFTLPMRYKVRISYGKQYGKRKKPGAAKKRRRFKAKVQKLRQKKFKPFILPPGIDSWQRYKRVQKECHALYNEGFNFGSPEAKKAYNKYRKRVGQPLVP